MARRAQTAQPTAKGATVARFRAAHSRFTGSRRARLTGGWFKRQWSNLLVVVLVLVLGFAALINKGVEATDLRLNEGAVYVQNQNRSMIGLLNYQIDSIAAATTVGDTASTLLQEGDTVLVSNAGSSTLQVYDPASNMLSAPVTPPAGALLSLNAGVLAVTNPENGKVWFGPVEEVSRSDFRGSANLDLLDWGRAIVTTSGNVIGLNVQDSTIVRADGSVVEIPFQVDSSAPTAQLSAVGERAVVLDRVSQQIWIEGDRQAVAISGSSAVLAPPMPDAAAAGRGGSIVYATQAGLNTIAGGAAQSLSGRMDAAPTQPVTVGECAYGAFTNRVVKVCAGGEPQIQEIPELPTGATLAFQVNRGSVVLQDTASGISWLVDKGMKIVNNWDDVTPVTEDTTDDPNPPDERVTLPDRTGPNRPPVAVDDPNLGARVGRSTVLPILDNDSDEDGDIITVVEFSEISGGPSLQLTGNGSGLQVTMPEDASGAYQFTYTISDGRGGTASAVATVTALAADQGAANRPPINIRPGQTTIVTSGTTIDKRALLNWRDPDGDELVLVNAQPESPESEDEVVFNPDGTISFRDVGKLTGPKSVRVWVSDGVATVEGEILLDVRKREAAPPIANGDFVSTVVNREIVVAPLANDEGNNLLLTEVDQSTEQYTVVANYPEGTFRFRATQAGVYYLLYKVNNGAVSTGLIRIDVREETTENHAPVAVRDTALVPFGGSVVIDPLLNDTDADNDVLVVQSISKHEAVTVVMQERHLITISMVTQTDSPVALTYWVSDGRTSTRGTIVVFPAPQSGNPVPRAVNDQVKIRAGASASVPVLNNDSSPIGLPIEVAALPDNPLGEQAWIDGERVRISIPESMPATTIPLTYQITDTGGRTDSATIFVTVISTDAQNEAPVPPLVEARVLSNSITRIPIKLAGVDPNGDSVRLLGLGSGPGLGRVVEIGDGWIRYESYPDSRGTDSFRYQVVDSFGAIGTGEIRIGVAPPSDDNTGPTGVPDEITVQPGRSVTLPVLINDYDIDGDQFGFREADAIEMEFPANIVDGQYITLTAPREPGDYVGTYHLIDKRGTPGQGTIFLHVEQDAPLLAPTALDDQVSVNDTLNQEWVEIDVLANDFDTDGPRDDLVLSLPAAEEGQTLEAAITAEGKLSVKVADAMQQVRYIITDADGNTAQALALVPGRNDAVPVLINPLADNTVEAGQVFTINFATMVQGTQDREVRLTNAETVRATKGSVNVRPDGIDFQADVRYAGPASVVFEVIDNTDPSDKSARRAFITVPITVTPADTSEGRGPDDTGVSNRAPEGPANITLEVGAGEPDQSFPLRGRFIDPEGDNFSFQSWTQLSADPGVTWGASVGGDVITASGGMTAKGAQATLQGTVVDAFGASREFTVTITVTGSTRPLPVAQTDVVEDANAGQQRTVSVLANDKSFLEDQALTLLSASVVQGSGTATVQGDQVLVTPADDYVGSLTVRYTIVDATQDSARQVDGAIQLTVRARPSQPGTPTIEEEGDKQVTIKWTSNSSNGMPVISQTVIATGANGSVVTFGGCTTNTCTITGLTNNVGYTFAVTEANELGDSDPSNSSAVGTPDVKPPQMSAPTLQFPGPDQPGRLVLNWVAPVFDGSPITTYTITSPDGSVANVPVTAPSNSYEFTNLTNYADYSFTITATNNKGTSDPSPLSNVEHPSGPPPAPAAPALADTNDPGGRQLQVSWTLPVGHRDPFTDVTLVLRGGGHVVEHSLGAVVDAAGTALVTGLNKRTNYVASVRVTTRGGVTQGPESAAVFTSAAPVVPVGGTLTANSANQLLLQIDNPDGRDWDWAGATLYQDGVPVGGEVSVQPGGSHVFQATGYGSSYTVQLVGVASYGAVGKRAQSAQGTNEATPYGTPQIINAEGIGWVEDQQVQIDTGEIQPNGTSNFAFSYSGSASGTFEQAGDVITFPTNRQSGSITLRVCDLDHQDNCSTYGPIGYTPAMTASAGDGRVNINVYFGSARCTTSTGGQEQINGSGSIAVPDGTTGTVTVTCSAGGNKHTYPVTFQ